MTDSADRQATLAGRFNRFDGLVAVNVVALLGTTAYAYATREAEFGLYAITTLVPVVLVWRALRHFPYPTWLLFLVQAAVLAHFSGGLLHVNGESLYAYRVAGLVRYDKLVHVANSAIAAVFMFQLLRVTRVRLGRAEGFVVVMTAAGLATLVEILEYAAVVTLPRTGVGGYHNNMQDLIANLLGAVAGWAVYRAMNRQPSD